MKAFYLLLDLSVALAIHFLLSLTCSSRKEKEAVYGQSYYSLGFGLTLSHLLLSSTLPLHSLLSKRGGHQRSPRMGGGLNSRTKDPPESGRATCSSQQLPTPSVAPIFSPSDA